MSLALSAPPRLLTFPGRLLLFGVVAAVGFLGGYNFPVEASIWVYNAVLTIFVDPGARIEPMAMGVGLGFLIGFIHLPSI